MTPVIIKKKKYNAFEVYDTKKEAFDRTKTISNNTSVYKTDDNKFAIFIKAPDVSNKF